MKKLTVLLIAFASVAHAQSTPESTVQGTQQVLLDCVQADINRATRIVELQQQVTSLQQQVAALKDAASRTHPSTH